MYRIGGVRAAIQRRCALLPEVSGVSVLWQRLRAPLTLWLWVQSLVYRSLHANTCNVARCVPCLASPRLSRARSLLCVP